MIKINSFGSMQSAFDHVARGVIGQGRLSENGGFCVYYKVDDDGAVCKCGIGHLMTDEDAQIAESLAHGRTVHHLLGFATQDDTEVAFPGVAEADSELPLKFLSDLQQAHDFSVSGLTSTHIEGFKRRMSELAFYWNLDSALVRTRVSEFE